MFNATDTMNSVRWLLNKYSWMAAVNDSQLPKGQKDNTYRPGLTDAEKKTILRLYSKGMSVYSIMEETGRSFMTIRKLLLAKGLYKGTQNKRRIKK